MGWHLGKYHHCNFRHLKHKKLNEKWSEDVNRHLTKENAWMSDEHKERWPGAVAHACNPSSLGGRGGRLSEVRSLRPAWLAWWNPVSSKNIKVSLALWNTPVIPGTQESEAGKLLKPRRQRLQWAEIVPLHSSLGDRERLHLKNKIIVIIKKHEWGEKSWPYTSQVII